MGNQFIEKQRFNKIWIIILIIPFVVINSAKMKFESNFIANSEFIITSVITIIVALLFLSIKLETVINDKEIKVRFFPLQIAFKTYAWKDIQSKGIRQYNAISEFGGWGIRIGWSKKKGKALIIGGEKGLQLEFKNGKKLLIGTQKPDLMNSFISDIKL